MNSSYIGFSWSDTITEVVSGLMKDYLAEKNVEEWKITRLDIIWRKFVLVLCLLQHPNK
jgi:hypothetical protein